MLFSDNNSYCFTIKTIQKPGKEPRLERSTVVKRENLIFGDIGMTL